MQEKSESSSGSEEAFVTSLIVLHGIFRHWPSSNEKVSILDQVVERRRTWVACDFDEKIMWRACVGREPWALNIRDQTKLLSLGGPFVSLLLASIPLYSFVYEAATVTFIASSRYINQQYIDLFSSISSRYLAPKDSTAIHRTIQSR
jgi:hypothetical protein